ncbi:MAG: M14 family zinc carboxypeptidase, partial [Bacteroidota bacterium]
MSLVVTHSQNAEWQTVYERSGTLETSRYQPTIDYCKQLAGASKMITYTTFGKSPQGRDLPMLIVDRDGLTTPEAIHASGRTLLLMEACIHAGECEGKDAGLMLIRDMILGGKANINPVEKESPPATKLLDNVSILFIPIFNVDGHERFGPFNRINQNGPTEMGWRTNANNLNLNRDFLKADTPEMQAWLQMFNKWMPDFFIDSHTTDGADYQYTLTYDIEKSENQYSGTVNWINEKFIPNMTSRVEKDGYFVAPYINLKG